jgi:hypothetical protein
MADAWSSPLKRGALIAGGSAVALFIVMFFDWFADAGQAADLARRAREAAEELGLDPRDEGAFAPVNGWSGLGWFQVALVISAIVMAIAFAAATYTEAAVGTPVALSSIVTGTGAIAFLALLYALINPPGDEVEREFGLYLGILATAGITYGGYLGMQEDRPPSGPPKVEPPPTEPPRSDPPPTEPAEPERPPFEPPSPGEEPEPKKPAPPPWEPERPPSSGPDRFGDPPRDA